MTVKNKTAILAFVPVLHQGYFDFLSKTDGDIWIFGKELISDYVHLGRDLRVLAADEMKVALQAVLPSRKISVANKSNLRSWEYELTIMPDDEVCHDLAEKYLVGKKTEFVQVFLRWNKVITFKEHEVPAHRKITQESFHKEIMKLAFEEAEKSSDWWRQIASFIVKERKILLRTHNHHLPTDFHLSVNGDPRSNFDAGQHQDIFTSIHAEAEAIAKAAKDGISLKGASLYATTFPCPNCARLIGTAGIKTVYYSKGYSLLDAEKILDHFGVEVVLVQ
jgi:dCMP deaminase